MTPTPFDEQADLIIYGKAGEAMGKILDRVKQILAN